ncbi:MAG: type I DNA topoisomerase [Gammaproteobacteria bacterium AqS3]|nr:type I DNA topoisomerase [Gammaproteobacteria bacterium AqS3]
MAKNLVIVESPAKAKTIKRYLGDGYTVESSVGHIRDLAKSTKSGDLGFDMNTWEANYQVSPDKKDVVKKLCKLAEGSEKIYLATDLDREGEAIAWHLQQCISEHLGQKRKKRDQGAEGADYLRVVFGEITKSAIDRAFAEPRALDMNRVNSQQARRLLDRLVGFRLSPLLWRKIARGLSAGRVQSVAVRLIVEREREVRAFKPEEYWTIEVLLKADGHDEPIKFELTRRGDKRISIPDQATAEAVLRDLRSGEYFISECVQKATSTKPSAPFITSTLQQFASNRLSFNVRRTMRLAQSLYEAGHITYMRTDSTNISAEAMKMCRTAIADRFGKKYVAEPERRYARAASAQEAHEAIRPTAVYPNGGTPAGLKDDEARLYRLISARFLASQMASAEYLNTVLNASCGEYTLRCSGRVVVFDGHTRALPTESGKQSVELPRLETGSKLTLSDPETGIESNQKFTSPPKFYGEAALVKELEKRGVGRPSTYASIISTIQDRGYVSLNKRVLRAEKLGEMVTDRLTTDFADLMQYDFTADLERELDRIACGELDYRQVLDSFHEGFARQLECALAQQAGRPSPPVEGLPCRNCGDALQVKFASGGAFLGCANFMKDEKCKRVISMDEVEPEGGIEIALRTAERCPECGNYLQTWHVHESNRRMQLCSNSPACKYTNLMDGEFESVRAVVECNKCDGTMEARKGRFGPYFQCTSPECGNTRKQLPSGEPAPIVMDPIPMPDLKCAKYPDDHYLLREGRSGLFLSASRFPKHREIRNPLLSEVLPVLGQLPESWRFLATGPVADPDDNPTVIRFSRKRAVTYLGSISESGKNTKWTCWYENGAWQSSRAG